MKLKKVLKLSSVLSILAICFCVNAFTVGDIPKYMDSLCELNGDGYYLSTPTESDRLSLNKYFFDENVMEFLDPFSRMFTTSTPKFVPDNLPNDQSCTDTTVIQSCTDCKKSFIIRNFDYEPVGSISLDFFEDENAIYVRCWVAKPFWGNEYAPRIAVLIAEKFHSDGIDVPFVVKIDSLNKKSLRAFEKAFDIVRSKYELKEEIFDTVVHILPVVGCESLLQMVVSSSENGGYTSLVSRDSVSPDIIKSGKYAFSIKKYTISPIF